MPWTVVLHNSEACMLLTSSSRQVKYHQLPLDFFWRGFFPLFRSQGRLALPLSSLTDEFLSIQEFIFSNIVRLFNETNFLAFVRNVRGVSRTLWHEFGVKICDCFCVYCEDVTIAFLSGQHHHLYRTGAYQDSFRLAQLCQMDQAQEKLSELYLWQKSRSRRLN